jgi:hypothetical protein
MVRGWRESNASCQGPLSCVSIFSGTLAVVDPFISNPSSNTLSDGVEKREAV